MVDCRLLFDELVHEQRYLEAYQLLITHPVDDSYDSFYCSSMCWVLNQLERYHEAQYYARKGIVLFPKEGFLYAQLGYAYLRMENDDLAYEAYKKAVDLHFDEAWVFGDMASILQDRGQLQEAVEYFESGLLDESDHIYCLLGAASCYLALKQYDIAIEYYEKGYRLDPNPAALYELICACSEANEYQLALMYLEQMHHPRYERWKRMEQGIVWFRQGYPQRALKYFESVLAIQPDLDVYKMMTRCFQLSGDRDKANEYANMVVELLEAQLKLSKPEEHSAIIQDLASYSECLFDQRQHLHYLNLAKESGISEVILWPYYAHAYLQLNDYYTALKYCELQYENGEHSDYLLEMYSWLLRTVKNHSLAIQILEESISLFGINKRTLEELILNELVSNKIEAAKEHANQLIGLNPNSWKGYYYMSWCFYSLEQHDKALDIMEKLESFSISDENQALVYELKGNILSELGQHQEAFDAYEKAYLYQEDGE